MAIMREVGVSKTTVWRWQEYFVEAGVEGLVKGRSKPPGKKPISAAIKLKIVEKTVKERPANATHWSVRTMAGEMGVSHTSVQRIWAEHGLKPHQVKSFKVSNDPDFADKIEDIVGLYLDPPEKALVLSIDEKSQIQALDRTQPGLPLKKGRAGTMTHDYKRNGTTTLFAALNMLDGKVIGECLPRHRSKEFVKFLGTIDRNTPAELDLHLIVDNYSTHKSPLVKRWLKRHPRFHLHFIPTSSSWLNMIERWFRNITDKAIRRGVFKSVPSLIEAIRQYLNAHNADPKIFTWTKDADTILAKIAKCKEALGTLR
jgi:transposase